MLQSVGFPAVHPLMPAVPSQTGPPLRVAGTAATSTGETRGAIRTAVAGARQPAAAGTRAVATTGRPRRPLSRPCSAGRRQWRAATMGLRHHTAGPVRCYAETFNTVAVARVSSPSPPTHPAAGALTRAF